MAASQQFFKSLYKRNSLGPCASKSLSVVSLPIILFILFDKLHSPTTNTDTSYTSSPSTSPLLRVAGSRVFLAFYR
jgi:hypothetical protein